MLRLYFPFILVAAAVLYGCYKLFFKKDKKVAKEIFSLTLFFAIIWFSVFYFIFK